MKRKYKKKQVKERKGEERKGMEKKRSSSIHHIPLSANINAPAKNVRRKKEGRKKEKDEG